MRAIGFQLRAELRVRWRSWLALAVLAGLLGGVLAATLACARRTESVVARYRRSSLAADVIVGNGGDFGNQGLDLARVRRLPQVAASHRGMLLDATVHSRSGADVSTWVKVEVNPGSRGDEAIDRPRLLAGRRPRADRPDEAVADRSALARLGVAPGERVRIRIQEGRLARPGPTAIIRIVGVRADLLSQGSITFVTVTPAFYRRYGGRQMALAAPRNAVKVRLRLGSRDVPAFQREVERLAQGRDFQFTPEDLEAAKLQSGFHLLAQTLRVVAALGAVALLLLLAQAIARTIELETRRHPVLIALGMTRTQLAQLMLARVALLVRPPSRTGHARALAADACRSRPRLRAAPRCRGRPAGSRNRRRPRTRRRSGAWAARRRARPSRVARSRSSRRRSGGRQACKGRAAADLRRRDPHGRRRHALGDGDPLAGHHERGHHRGRRGRRDAHAVREPRSPARDAAAVGHHVGLRELPGARNRARRRHGPVLDPAIGAASFGEEAVLSIGARRIGVAAFDPIKGALAPTVLAGRAPRALGQVMLGARTFDAIHASLGEPIRLRRAGRSVRLTVVGRGVLPETDFLTLGEGAAMRFGTLKRLVPGAFRSRLLLRIAPGADREAVLERLERTYFMARPGLPRQVLISRASVACRSPLRSSSRSRPPGRSCARSCSRSTPGAGSSRSSRRSAYAGAGGRDRGLAGDDDRRRRRSRRPADRRRGRSLGVEPRRRPPGGGAGDRDADPGHADGRPRGVAARERGGCRAGPPRRADAAGGRPAGGVSWCGRSAWSCARSSADVARVVPPRADGRTHGRGCDRDGGLRAAYGHCAGPVSLLQPGARRVRRHRPDVGLQALSLAGIRRLPQVRAVSRGVLPNADVLRGGGGDVDAPVQLEVLPDPDGLEVVDRPKLLAGRLPTPGHPDEVVADARAMRTAHLALGDTLTVRLRLGRRAVARTPIALRIVGVRPDMSPEEAGSFVSATPGSFYRAHGGSRIAVAALRNALKVRLWHGTADVPAFERGAERLAHGHDFQFTPFDVGARTMQSGLHLQAQRSGPQRSSASPRCGC